MPAQEETLQFIRLRHAVFALTVLVIVFALGATRGWAQSSPTTEDLQKKIDDLQKQILEMKAQLASLQPASASAASQGLVSSGSSSQPTAPAPTLSSLLGPTTLSGFVDAYYGYNSNQPSNFTNSNQFFNPYSNQFGLNMIELVMDKAPDASASRTGYHVALGFGSAMNAINGSDPAGLGFAQYLKEGYFSYLAPVGKGLQVDVGKFVTPAGAEVIESKDNWNYTRSLLFYYAIPYFHYGARAKYIFNDKFSLSGYLVNGWNNIVAMESGKTYGLSLAWNPTKKVSVIENYLAGPQLAATVDPGGSNSSWRQLWDTVVSYSPNSKLALMVNGDYGRGDRYSTLASTVTPPVSWYGAAGYIKYAFNNKYTIATRYEYFNDPNGFATGLGPTVGLGQHLQEGTFTFERDIASHIISRLEYRHDASSEPFFQKGPNPFSEKSQNTATLGLIFTFSTSETK
jgi:putative OmpL-like beta-barrel porin-2